MGEKPSDDPPAGAGTAGLRESAAQEFIPSSDLKNIRFGPEICRNLEKAASREWVISNGLGGYAASTIVGMNTRRYHGLLVAATHPPVGRVVLLSAVDETLVFGGGRFDLASHRYGNVIHPEGYKFLEEFCLDPAPTFRYRVGEVLLEKIVFPLPGENAVVIGYTLLEAPGPLQLAIRPLIAVRNFRWVCEENPNFKTRLEEQPGVLALSPYEGMPPLFIHHSAELVEKSPCWYKNFEYVQERQENRRVLEDLWTPGQLLYLLKAGESCSLVASTGRRGGVDLTFHLRRLENTQSMLARSLKPPGNGPFSARLCWTSEHFIARRPGAHSVGSSVPKRAGGQPDAETYALAGFYGLSVWGRDSLVALPGLCLATGRLDLAREMLETLVSRVKWGLIPVRLTEEGAPEYDSADTSLWFFWAVWHYWKAAKDIRFVSKKLMGLMREIMEAYFEGTNFGIGMAEDGLIQLSDHELPLTWMDAREPGAREDLPGKAVTPRWGKPVEINALWYCAVSIMYELSERMNLGQAAGYGKLSRLIGESFQKTFIGSGAIYDRVAGNLRDSSIRPNMVIAAGLPYTPFSIEHIEKILELADLELLTPCGLRTLSPRHPDYRGQWIGDLKDKAHAYHQGTVWSWLIGPYVSALIRARGLTSAVQERIRVQMEPFERYLEEGGLGSISEIFDGDYPHHPRGGLFHAWAVGEFLRVIELAKLKDV